MRKEGRGGRRDEDEQVGTRRKGVEREKKVARGRIVDPRGLVDLR